MQKQEFSTEIGGEKLTATFSDLAEKADGSVMLTYGDTTVLATAVMAKNRREGLDFFPLTVDYEEKFYAAGSILGSRFMRREGRPSEEATLSGRVIDRTIRPLFDHTIRNEVQVVITVLSFGSHDPDVLAVNAASLALATSDIPWGGPVSATRVQKNDSGVTTYPTYSERETSQYEIIVCGVEGAINMIEASGNEISEEEMGKAFDIALADIEAMQKFQHEIIAEIGKGKRTVEHTYATQEMRDAFEREVLPHLHGYVFAGVGNKHIEELHERWRAHYKEAFPEESISFADEIYDEAVNDILHTEALDNDLRADGRAMDEVRPLYAQAGGVSPVLHGSGIFYRGGTHIFSALTLGGSRDTLIQDGMETQGEKRFMHHYNFPPFSVGETGRLGGTSRRAIGHGALAERALLPVIPDKEAFPYTIRLVSEAFSSNGSTSMGSVCASTLALMDGGVPIKRPVAGIAMGLIMAEPLSTNNQQPTTHNKQARHKILTDIQGPEDHHGDMDFKVAGTENGITAIQMDIKVGGIPADILKEALGQARAARLKILETITKAIPEPRAELTDSAPRIVRMSILPDQIGLVIGPSGKTINKLKADTGVEEIDIDDDGTVLITGKKGTAEKAQQQIKEMTREYKVGERAEGEVVKILDFGAVVKISPAAEGLVHISEIAPFHIGSVKDVLSEGETVPVVVKEVGDRGKIKLSIKAADPDFAKKKGVGPVERDK